MSKINVLIGSVTVGNNVTLDTTRHVAFEGKKLATHRQADIRNGHITDSRRTVETLYRTADGRLIVHVGEWSHWQGKLTTYQICQITEDELCEQYPFLAAGAGAGRPLTLDEALALNSRPERGENQ